MSAFSSRLRSSWKGKFMGGGNEWKGVVEQRGEEKELC